MKKTLSVFVAVVILVSSMLSLNAYAAGTKTDALFDKLKSSQEVCVSLEAGDVNLFGSFTASASDTVYIKGNKVAYEYDLGFLSAHVVYNGESVYGFLPQLPFFFVKLNADSLGQPDVLALIESAADITLGVLAYQRSYNEIVGDTEYYVEEFNDRAQVTSKFYYLGDSLVKLVVTDAQSGSVQVTNFNNISFTVSDSVFEIPATAFDLTVFLKILFEAFISA